MDRSEQTLAESTDGSADREVVVAPCGRVLAGHSRRTVLRGVALAGGVGVLAACGGGSDDGGGSGDDASSGGSDDSGGSTEEAAPSGTELGPTSDVEVGGGRIYEEQKIVVTQPTEGDFKAFTAVCTHQGCVVSEVTSDAIVCNCHNSEFSPEDGSVLGGPAGSPLDAAQITVANGTITLA